MILLPLAEHPELLVYQRTHTYILSLLRFPYNCEASISRLRRSEILHSWSLQAGEMSIVMYIIVYILLGMFKYLFFNLIQLSISYGEHQLYQCCWLFFLTKNIYLQLLPHLVENPQKRHLFSQKHCLKADFCLFQIDFWLAEIWFINQFD